MDTSILCALYWAEDRSAQVHHLVAAARGRAISWLSEVEFESALARKVRNRELAGGAATQIQTAFRHNLAQGRFERLAVVGEDYRRARDWLASLAVRLATLDALHLAIAARHGCELATADVELAAAAKRVGVAVQVVG